MKISRVILLSLCLFISFECYSQEKSLKFTSEISYGLNGVFDILGYEFGLGVSKNFTEKNAVLLKIQLYQFNADEFHIIYFGESISDQVLAFQILTNHNFRISKRLAFVPTMGGFLKNHHWVIITKNGFVELGTRYIPPNSQDVWNDFTVGYCVAFPFKIQLRPNVDLNLGAVYENDTFGYSYFGVQAGLQIQIKPFIK
jgi:hypothetical protein